MSRKRQNESDLGDNVNKKSAKIKQLSFDQIASIIKHGDSKKLKEVIESKQILDINARCGYSPSQTLLNIAFEAGSIECATVLLNNNANINDDAILTQTCRSGNMDMIRFVIDRGFLINDTILLCLFDYYEVVNNIDVATVLFGHIQDVNHRLYNESSTFLMHGCRAGHLPLVRTLLERGSDRDVVSWNGDALSSASRCGHLDIVQLVLGWDTGNWPFAGESIKRAIEIAAAAGQLSTLSYLIDLGADIDTLTISLHAAVKYNKVDTAEFLINRGADFNSIDSEGHTPLISACKKLFIDLVRLLLARGADPNNTDPRGECPLMITLFKPGYAKLLLEHGADPNRYLTNGCTMLIYIIKCGYHPEMLKLLLGHGADPNLAHIRTGQTPLMNAAVALRVDPVKVLLEYGADVTQVNTEGKSVLDMLGRTRKYGEVVELCTAYIDSNKPGANLLLK